MASNDIGSLVVELRADIKQLQAQLKTGQNEVKSFADSSKGAFAEIGKTLAGLFAAEKIIQFFKLGAEEALQMERAIRTLNQQISRLGLDVNKTTAEIKAYADEVQATTIFQDDEVVTSIANLTRMTGDYTKAIQLNKVAMGLSRDANIGLEEAAKIVGMVFQGNERGVSQLLRIYPQFSKEVKAGGDALTMLQEKVKGLDTSMSPLEGGFNQTGKAVKETAEAMFNDLAPGLLMAAEGFKKVMGVLNEAWRGIVKVTQTISTVFGLVFVTLLNVFNRFVEGVNLAANVIGKALKGDISGAMKTAWKGINEIGKKGWEQFTNDAKGAEDEITEITKKSAEKQMGIDKKLFDEKLKSRAKTVVFEKETVDGLAEILNKKMKHSEVSMNEIFATIRKGSIRMVQQAGESLDHFKERVKKAKDDVQAMTQATMERVSAVAAKISGAMTDSFRKMFEESQKGTLTTAKAFEILGKSIFKSIVKALGEILIQMGVKQFIEAVISLASEDYGGAAKHGAAGAVSSAAGGAMIGLAEAALAEGGIVTKPTIALIGENGPEKVIPLDKEQASSLSVGQLHINLPNVRNPSDFANSRTAQSASRILLKVLDDTKRRGGLRLGTI